MKLERQTGNRQRICLDIMAASSVFFVNYENEPFPLQKFGHDPNGSLASLRDRECNERIGCC